MKPLQTIKTPSGEELVVLSRADYEALINIADSVNEDAEDVAIYDARKADDRGSILMPDDVNRALLGGATLLKALRQWKNVGQVQLAKSTGYSQGYLSDLENGNRTMTIEVSTKIAKALSIPVGWLNAAAEIDTSADTSKSQKFE